MGAALAVPAALVVFALLFVVTLIVDGPAATSAREQRSLARWPAISLDAVLEGSWARDVDAWVVDHFPARDAMLDLSAELRTTRGLTADVEVFGDDALGEFGLASSLDVDGDDDDDDDGIALPGSRAPDAGVDRDNAGAIAAGVVANAGVVVDAGAANPGPPTHGDQDAIGRAANKPPGLDGAATVLLRRGIVVAGDRALMLQVGSDDDARAFAAALNEWAAALPGVRLTALVTPTASHYYLPASWQPRSLPQAENLRAVRDALDPRIGWVDVDGALAPHTDEEIFFRTDHHWTARGAWYAYAAWAGREGLTPVPLEALERRTHPPVLGSLYRVTQSPLLRDRADLVEYWLPRVPHTAERWRSPTGPPRAARVIDEREASYATFLGGDAPLIVVRTEAGTGRRLLLVKNSYGNALAPWLLPHVDELVVVDYRSWPGDVAALAREHRVTDVLLQNATVTLNSRRHARRMRDLLHRGPPLRIAPVDTPTTTPPTPQADAPSAPGAPPAHDEP